MLGESFIVPTPRVEHVKNYNTTSFRFILKFKIRFSFAAIKEYCQMDKFKPECGNDAVIVVEHAKYGRMRMGHCVTVNYGNIGCAVDVRNYLDTLCSGRQACEIVVPDERMFESKPCPKDVTSYLEASYRCQKGNSSCFVVY